MKTNYTFKFMALLCFGLLLKANSFSQVIISQYYEGTGTNKWIELTNLGGTAVNTASPQLKLGLWSVAGSTGNIVFSGAATNTVNLTITIPAYGSVLIGNTSNGTEVPYLTAGSAAQTDNGVINFNGNDGVALLDASSNIIDQFGNGINAADISYVRNLSVVAPSATYVGSQWTSATLASVQTAGATSSIRLNYHLNTACVTPTAQPTSLVFGTITSNSIAGSFTGTVAADEYLVVRATSASLTANPTDGVVYSAGNTFGNGTVVSRGTSTSFSATGLSASTTYYFFVFSIKSSACTGGPKYRTTSPLSGSAATIEAPLFTYFGNFHSHSQYSDGTGLPSGDFTFGDAANCMDFLGISEHNHASAGMSLANWAPGRAQAAAATTSTFLAMYGMEWGVISGGGHVVVYGVDSLIGWDAGQYQIYVPQSVYTGSTGLFNMINRHGGNAFATLAHPNNADYNGIMSTYDVGSDDAVVGAAVENGPSTSTNTTYTDPPSSMLYLSYYRNMLARGYHLGPTMDHDNHNVTHGHTSTIRTAVLSPTLTEADMLASMRQMRFYATEDCGAYVTYKIGTNKIGSIVTAAGTPTITVTTTTTNPVTLLKIYSGVPGSGTNATILTSVATGSITYTDAALANLASKYYYIDITESDGTRIVTAPIWYTRNDAARMTLPVAAIKEFFSINESNKVTLKWVTTNESLYQDYIIEKSTDDINYYQIDAQKSIGAGVAPVNYATVDNNPSYGTSYYRLTQKDARGNIIYSAIKTVERSAMTKPELTVFPNPIKTSLQLNITNAATEKTQIIITDITGKAVFTQYVQLTAGEQNISLNVAQLKKGYYILNMIAGNSVINKKIIKE